MIKLVVCSGLQDREPLSETSSGAFVPQPFSNAGARLGLFYHERGKETTGTVSFGSKYSYFNGYDVMNY